MNYRHAYHAGSFADVFKHSCLVALIRSLSRKDTPFCYLDTHAGAGRYDLLANAAQKSQEYRHGIHQLPQQSQAPAPVQDYLAGIAQINSATGPCQYYPGSPLLVRHLLRPQDRIIACELHPQDYQTLHATFANDKHVAVHHMDGYLALKAFLPPPERRGLVLIDPPYEHPDEFAHMTNAVKIALKRWETGMYALWYPIKERFSIERFYQNIKQNVHRPILAIELSIYPEDSAQHLNGCGLLTINPPWQFEATVQGFLPWLWKILSKSHQGTHRLYLLK